MESFVIRPTTWPVLRLFSRNPLMRTADRVEAAVGALAVLLVVVAAACAGAIGTMLHDTQTQNYLDQARTRHVVVANAVDDSRSAGSAETTSTVHARWQVNGINHADVIASGNAVKAGAQLKIWVDADGNVVAQPTPESARRYGRMDRGVCGLVRRRRGGRARGGHGPCPRETHAGRSVGSRDSIPCRGRRWTHQQFAVSDLSTAAAAAQVAPPFEEM